MDWSERYSTPLNDVFSRQHKLELEWKVELALLKALGEQGLAPTEAYEEAKAVIACTYTRDFVLPARRKTKRVLRHFLHHHNTDYHTLSHL